MRPPAPPLVARIVEQLASDGGPIPSATLAEQHLGLGRVSEEDARRLLSPLLAQVEGVQLEDGGWTLASRARRWGIPLAAPVAVVLARAAPALSAARIPPEGAGGPTIAVSGEQEVRTWETLEGQRLPRPAYSLARLVRRLRGYRGARPTAFDLAAHLGACHVEGDDPRCWLDALGAAWEVLVAELALEGVVDTGGLDALLERSVEPASFADADFGPAEIEALDEGPGVYVFYASTGAPLYVGQSACLRRRVASYFRGPPRDAKDREIRRHATQLETFAADTSLDALLDEQRRIERLRPHLNTRRHSPKVDLDPGLLLVPAAGRARWVILALGQGGILGRGVAGGGPRRRGKTLRRVAAALGSGGCGGGGALVRTWLRHHPGALHLRVGFDGTEEDLLRRAALELGAT